MSTFTNKWISIFLNEYMWQHGENKYRISSVRIWDTKKENSAAANFRNFCLTKRPPELIRVIRGKPRISILPGNDRGRNSTPRGLWKKFGIYIMYTISYTLQFKNCGKSHSCLGCSFCWNSEKKTIYNIFFVKRAL